MLIQRSPGSVAFKFGISEGYKSGDVRVKLKMHVSRRYTQIGFSAIQIQNKAGSFDVDTLAGNHQTLPM
jgi:hypothetical protein